MQKTGIKVCVKIVLTKTYQLKDSANSGKPG